MKGREIDGGMEGRKREKAEMEGGEKGTDGEREGWREEREGEQGDGWRKEHIE